jgi:hypothetical protein
MALCFNMSNLSVPMQTNYYLAYGHGPLCTRSNRLFALAEIERYRGWGDVDYDLQKEEEARLSDAEREARAAKEAAEEAEKKRLEPMIALHHQQQGAMINRARNARNKDRVGFKDARPCRSLYDYDRDHGCKTNHMSTECWAHEFTDALSSEFLDSKGQLTAMAIEYAIPRAVQNGEARIGKNQSGVLAVIWKPHGCWMTHPGEPGWNPKWVLNRSADPVPAPAPQGHRHGQHQGYGQRPQGQRPQGQYQGQRPQSQRPPEPQYKPTKKTQNRFALDEDD